MASRAVGLEVNELGCGETISEFAVNSLSVVERSVLSVEDGTVIMGRSWHVCAGQIGCIVVGKEAFQQVSTAAIATPVLPAQSVNSTCVVGIGVHIAIESRRRQEGCRAP